VPLTSLPETKSLSLAPASPYNFNANFHKPSHFPSSDTEWLDGCCWATILWQSRALGLRFRNEGTTSKPQVRLTVFSKGRLNGTYLDGLVAEIRWRFNFDQDVSEFTKRYGRDEHLGGPIRRRKGMKPIAANSLYESLMIYITLQNATVRRTVQMLENLFLRFGQRVSFDGRTLSVFWPADAIAMTTVDELRTLKVGYRAKSIMKISEQFASGSIDGTALRGSPKVVVAQALDNLYGIGPSSIQGILFEDFYFLDSLDLIPPWERKIMSRLLFRRSLVPAERILRFFRERYPRYEFLAFSYIWEDLFWRRKHERIEWLEREVRL
jgi:3-methyladenine DNA glycosylase/8-oxoguanine DNA glycosylase